jgi:uncharacterized protein YjbI with pentapeptide repeats
MPLGQELDSMQDSNAPLENEAALKAKLIEQLGSNDDGISWQALYLLNEHGWLRDGSLKNAKLMGANLFEAFLNIGIDLSGADLTGATLLRADLTDSNLENVTLIQADLRGSLLFGTKLLDANLREANLEGAVFDENTVLPDGTHWTEDTDMTRFTDPNHSDFWDANAIKERHET